MVAEAAAGAVAAFTLGIRLWAVTVADPIAVPAPLLTVVTFGHPITTIPRLFHTAIIPAHTNIHSLTVGIGLGANVAVPILIAIFFITVVYLIPFHTFFTGRTDHLTTYTVAVRVL